MKVLILENDVSTAKTLRELLIEKGWEVDVAHFWDKARPLLKEKFFDLLILEVLLPDVEGLEILKTLPEKSKNSSIWTAVISRFTEFSSAVEEIHPSLKDKCVFFKKPFEEEDFLNFLQNIPKVSSSIYSPVFKLFFESKNDGNPFFETVDEKRMFQNHDLIFIIMEAHHQKWSGIFTIKTSKEEITFYFEKGMIYKVSKDHRKSIFGALLIKHGLVLNEDIQNIIDENKDTTSGLFIGRKLIAHGLLSPHIIQLILKDQIKIRLLESLNIDSFQLEIKKSNPQNIDYDDKVYFSKKDFIVCLIEGFRSYLKADFFQHFLSSISFCLIQKSSPLPDDFLLIKHEFLDDYTKWFQNLKDSKSIENILSDSKDNLLEEKFLCFSLLLKIIQLKEVKKSAQEEQIREISYIVSSILDENSTDIFKIAGLAKTASEEEIKSAYRKLTKVIHPDFIPQSAQLELKQRAEKAFQKLKSLYDIISNKDKREAYIKSEKDKEFIDIMNIYGEGISKIKQERYYEGLKFLSKIENSGHAPQELTLYMIWAKLKMLEGGLDENRREMTEIKKHIDLCSVSLQLSHLFWYVKGLFCLKLEKHERSREFLKKSLQLKGSFEAAKKDLILVNQKIKKSQNKKGLLAFFQKKTG